MKVEEPAVKYERLMSPQEYLEWERKQEIRHEYAEGFIITMQGASMKHEGIVTNLIGNIHPFLKGNPCKVFPSNLRTYVKTKESYFYPDASIICGEAVDFGDQNDISQDPCVIFEVLSPSTREFDLVTKFFYYSQIPTLKEFIVIDSLSVFVRAARRQEDNSWKFEEYNSLDQKLFVESVQLEMPLEDIYYRV
jgi:Uma2 family endonuclease